MQRSVHDPECKSAQTSFLTGRDDHQTSRLSEVRVLLEIRLDNETTLPVKCANLTLDLTAFIPAILPELTQLREVKSRRLDADDDTHNCSNRLCTV